MIDKNHILEELKKITAIDEIHIDSFDLNEYKFSPIKEYIENLKFGVKRETAASDLLKQLLDNIIGDETKGRKANTEVNIEGSFIDYVVREAGSSNPICIELKPLFRLDSKKENLKQDKVRIHDHKDQIQKYLRYKQVEYIILTNLNHAYIFNRNAILDYKPIIETTLSDIFEQYLSHESLWDTIRRYEDNITLFDLDKLFFADLKKWYEELSKIELKENGSVSKEEMIVLFLNKFIFIKTLEDYGLIPYHFIQDEYKRYIYKWEAKGNEIIFKHFFDEIEEFFEMYYDTELFTSNFWDFVDKKDNNIDDFKNAFELILGLDAWSETFGKGLTHYNYRKIDEDIFGKAYETWIAENKKDEGIYYTPSVITEYMANKLVDNIFDDIINELSKAIKENNPDIIKINKLIEKLRSFKIIDTASGSGSFLIKVLKAIYQKYKKIEESTRWVADIHHDNIFDVPPVVEIINGFRKKMFFSNGTELHLISSIILNHIFAADKDERAIETAKTNIWKEAVKLNPRIYNYRRLDRDKIHILPNLALNFITGNSLTDSDFDSQIEIMTKEFEFELIKLFEIREKYIQNPYKPDILDKAKEIKNKIRKRLKKEPGCFDDSLFFPLEYFFCYFTPDGKTLPKEDRGFNAIIGNPPWEAIKPVKKEFAKKGKYEMDVLEFNSWFSEQLKNDDNFKQSWDDYCDFYKNYNEYLYEKYQYQSSGDPNYYKFFIERDFQLICKNGYFCLLVPSGFQTDEGSNKLRSLIIEENKLLELSSFENKGYNIPEKKHLVKLFPDVHPQFKFSIIFSRKEKTEDYNFKAKFYLHDPKELLNDEFVTYNIEKIRKFSPENLSIMEFRTERDYELCLKILSENDLLFQSDFTLRREFDMTNDSYLFLNKDDKKIKKLNGLMPLYEGKMIHQFDSSYSEHRYLIEEQKARKVLLHKVLHRIKSQFSLTKEEMEKLVIPEDLLLDYQTYRLVYRAIGSSTNERSLICSITPKNVFAGNSLIHSVNLKYDILDNAIIYNVLPYTKLLFLFSILNSLTLNYYIRNKISANLNMFFIYELPIAEASEEEKKKIIDLGFSLLYRKSRKEDFEDLKNELGIGQIDDRPLEEIRAELEIIIAKKLYKLDKSDWEYLTSTFTFGGESETKKELDQIIKISLEKW